MQACHPLSACCSCLSLHAAPCSLLHLPCFRLHATPPCFPLLAASALLLLHASLGAAASSLLQPCARLKRAALQPALCQPPTVASHTAAHRCASHGAPSPILVLPAARNLAPTTPGCRKLAGTWHAVHDACHKAPELEHAPLRTGHHRHQLRMLHRAHAALPAERPPTPQPSPCPRRRVPIPITLLTVPTLRLTVPVLRLAAASLLAIPLRPASPGVLSSATRVLPAAPLLPSSPSPMCGGGR